MTQSSDNRMETIKLITPPTYSGKKESPKKAVNIAIAMIVGLVLGLGTALVKELLDHSVSNEADYLAQIRDPDLPLLGSIPDLKKG